MSLLPLLSSASSMASPRTPLRSLPIPAPLSLAPPLLPSSSKSRRSRANRCGAFFNPIGDQPILKDAAKEPVAFLGGVFAGILRLSLNEDPLREWIARTVEASGISPDEVANAEETGEWGGGGGRGNGGAAQEIEIE